MSAVTKDMEKSEPCEYCDFIEGAYYFDDVEGKKFRGYCHLSCSEIPCECPLPHGEKTLTQNVLIVILKKPQFYKFVGRHHCGKKTFGFNW